MSAQIVIAIFLLLRIAWEAFLTHLQNKQRNNPLPSVVADIYDSARYQDYLTIASEEKRLCFVRTVVESAVDFAVLFSPLFAAIDTAFGPSPYLVLFASLIAIKLLYLPLNFLCSWWYQFKVEGRHGLNNQSTKSFASDYVREEAGSTVFATVLFEIIAFICENVSTWTGNFSLGFTTTVSLCLGILAILFLLSFVALLVGIKIERMGYQFKPLPAGPLRDEIEAMLSTCKKKVRAITVYDESSKSTTKNAAVLNVPWRREITIADNFLNENSHGELMAVVAHEIGHLKHRRGFSDLGRLMGPMILLLLICLLLTWPAPVMMVNDWVTLSFGLGTTNYYLDILLVTLAFGPALMLVNAASNFLQRKNEYEADQEAVRAGYGNDLAEMLKKAARDELKNINPHPFIEMLECDHPGMANRLAAIYAAMEKEGLS